jgi:hypothetical protein
MTMLRVIPFAGLAFPNSHFLPQSLSHPAGQDLFCRPQFPKPAKMRILKRNEAVDAADQAIRGPSYLDEHTQQQETSD